MTRTTSPRTDVVTRRVVTGDLLEMAWETYTETFDSLRSEALQRHLYTRREFDDVMGDVAVTKYVGRHLATGRRLPAGATVDSDGARVERVCALATFTQDLRTMPLISPEYFAARWPDHYARGRCFYIGFVGVHPAYHRTGVFVDIVSDMTTTVTSRGGVAVLDVCTRNSETYQLPQAILRIAQAHEPRVTGTPVDQQTYWAYEAPTVVDLRSADRTAAPVDLGEDRRAAG